MAIGTDGQFYYDISSGQFYGPRSGGAWPALGSPAALGGSSVQPQPSLMDSIIEFARNNPLAAALAFVVIVLLAVMIV